MTKEVAKATCPRSNGNVWIKYNVLDAVKGFVQNPSTNFGFLLKNTSGAQEIDFPSSESNKTEQRPKLTIVYEKSTAILHPMTENNSLSGKLHIQKQRGVLQMLWSGAEPETIRITRPDGSCVFSGTITPGNTGTATLRSAGVYCITIGKNTAMFHSLVSIVP